MSATAALKLRYPTKAEISRVVEAAKACGLDVAGVEVCPGGAIRVVEARAVPQQANDFDRWADKL